MISRLSLLLLLFSGTTLMAGDDDPSLAIANIPDSLLENSYAVVRNEEMIYEVRDLDKAILTYRMTLTLLNSKYKQLADISVPYDPGMTLKKLAGRKYDKAGNQLDVLKTKDIRDYSHYTGSFYDDNRIKNFDLSYAEYPYTFQVEYSYDINSLYRFPDWNPLTHFNMSVENSSFTVIIPKNLSFRYRAFNLAQSCVITEEEENNTYKWEVKNLKAIEREPGMADIHRYVPYLITSPDRFVYDKYPGDLSSWESYGEWVKSLLDGRGQLSPESMEFIKNLVDTIPERTNRIRVLYEYMQKNTRYISIQLGIGGNQPFEAGFVDEYGYGDCKALSNYMRSLLSAVGIRSHYTLVNAGRYIPDIHWDFPSDQFNHIILCIPDEKDTLWLECTSQVNPFGYLGSFTDNRHVLAITEDGGKIVKTPCYNKENNLQVRNATVRLEPTGDARASINTFYSGLQYENIQPLLDANPGDQQKWLYENLDIPHFELKKFTYQAKKASIPEAEEQLELDMRRYVTLSGKRIFLQPNFLNRQKKLPPPARKRIFEVELKMPYIDSDTIEYEIPAGYHLEFIPEPVEISSRFGNYTAVVSLDGNRIRYVRIRSANKGIFPPDTYPEYVDFINRIAAADNMKLVFVNKT